MILYDFNPQWVLDRLDDVDDFGPCAALGVEVNGKIACGVVFHDWQSRWGTVQVSIASDNPMWARRGNIAEILKYPYYQMGCYLVWSATPTTNMHAIKTNRHIGFEFEAILEHRFGRDIHAYMGQMTRDRFEGIYSTELQREAA